MVYNGAGEGIRTPGLLITSQSSENRNLLELNNLEGLGSSGVTPGVTTSDLMSFLQGLTKAQRLEILAEMLGGD